VVQYLVERLSKSGTCFGNVVCNLLDWKQTEAEAAVILKHLITSLKEVSMRQMSGGTGTVDAHTTITTMSMT